MCSLFPPELFELHVLLVCLLLCALFVAVLHCVVLVHLEAKTFGARTLLPSVWKSRGHRLLRLPALHSASTNDSLVIWLRTLGEALAESSVSLVDMLSWLGLFECLRVRHPLLL